MMTQNDTRSLDGHSRRKKSKKMISELTLQTLRQNLSWTEGPRKIRKCPETNYDHCCSVGTRGRYQKYGSMMIRVTMWIWKSPSHLPSAKRLGRKKRRWISISGK